MTATILINYKNFANMKGTVYINRQPRGKQDKKVGNHSLIGNFCVLVT